MNRTLLDLVRSMLHHKGIDKKFWAEAIANAAYIRNRVTSRGFPPGTTPYHLWHGKNARLIAHENFGSPCWYVIPKSKVRKLDPRSKKGVMMGYSNESKGYKIWDPQLKKFIVSRDVTFSESCTSDDNTVIIEHDLFPTTSGDLSKKSEAQSVPDQTSGAEEQVNSVLNHMTVSNQASNQQNGEDESVSSQTVEPEVSGPVLRRSSRKPKPTSEWWIAPSASNNEEKERVDTSLSAITALCAADVPQSYSEAMSPDNVDFWAPGIKREEACIRENNTFTLVKRRPEMHALPCRYVFKIKNGCPKVHIVAKGFRQIHGVDYNETFAPVVTLSAVRFLLVIVAYLDLDLFRMDVITAFLNGDLSEDIYMEVPEGFKDPSKPNTVCKLHKALYGLKQAPRQWYSKIHRFLETVLHFRSCPYEPCLYIRHHQNRMILIGLDVDDILIAGNDESGIKLVESELSKRFRMKYLGEASEFLGIKIVPNRSKRTPHISQAKCIDQVLAAFKMTDAKISVTPMELVKQKYSPTHPSDEPVKAPFRQAIGSLIWISICTRPDC